MKVLNLCKDLSISEVVWANPLKTDVRVSYKSISITSFGNCWKIKIKKLHKCNNLAIDELNNLLNYIHQEVINCESYEEWDKRLKIIKINSHEK